MIVSDKVFQNNGGHKMKLTIGMLVKLPHSIGCIPSGNYTIIGIYFGRYACDIVDNSGNCYSLTPAQSRKLQVIS